jgi:hypothetical protein
VGFQRRRRASTERAADRRRQEAAGAKLLGAINNDGLLFTSWLSREETPLSTKDIEFILGSVGAEADVDKVNLLLKGLEGKDILEVIPARTE